MTKPDAVMWSVGTLNPHEAVEFWNEKKAREDAEAAAAERVAQERAAEQEAQERQAKVVRPATSRKGPRGTEGVQTK